MWAQLGFRSPGKGRCGQGRRAIWAPGRLPRVTRAQLQLFDGFTHQVVPLTGSTILGGRHGVRVQGSTRTRRQARIFEEAGRFWIEDLGGDGVWVNGVRVERAGLMNRDQLRVGSLQLDYFEE